ncbi:MAG: GAF domain-containing protein [Chloroflexi bacterium]|nr:GAF domain-containing protein [Chloroflexota bacterium]
MRSDIELEILRDISMAITSTLDLEQILRRVYESVHRVMNTDTFFIALYAEPERELRFEFLVDNGASLPKITQRLDDLTGLSGWIIAHKKPLVIGDLQNARDLPVQPSVIGSPTRSWLGVPLIVQDRLIGVMSVQSYAPDRFDRGHLQLLDAIANQISIVIENARLFAQMRARADELVVANEITRAINSTLNLDEVLKLFFDRMSKLFNIEAGALVLLDPLTDELVFEVVHGGAGESLLHKRMRSNEGIVGWVTQHGQPLLVPDVRRDPRWFKGFDKDTRFVTRSVLAAPIQVADRTIGAVELINRRDGSPFTEADEKLLGMFAASAGIAIENARLHRQTEKRLAEVTTLNLIANQLATSLDVNEILNLIVARLMLIFNCRTCSIHLLNPARQVLELEAESGMIPTRVATGVALGQGIVGRVARDGSPIYIQRAEDAPADAELNPGTEAMLTVPLTSHDRVLGTLSLDCDAPHAFNEDDQRLLTTVAAQIATAVENGQLYEDLRDRAERLKQAYDDLKELDRLKTEFVQNMSHELRTPLTFIKGYVELLRTDTLGELPAAARDGMNILADKTDALVRLVNDILSLQQAEADTLRLASVNLGLLARATVRTAMFAAEQAHVDLREDIAPGLPDTIGDAERLAQVFENLIENAIKFSPNGGEVCVRVFERDSEIQAQVQDHGIGIAPDQVEKIFTRFYQVDGSTTRRFGGVGLGLAIVKRIVEAHKGRVWVASVAGKGSTFYFAIPKAVGQSGN